tara:strand:- start:150 stop:1415 length:1266 start_codon:yes stop_codon:yes gene_type:complete
MHTATYNAYDRSLQSNGNTGTSNDGPGGSASGNLNDYGSFETVLPSSLQGNPVFTVSGWFKQNSIAHLQLAWLVGRNLRVTATPGLSNKMHWLGITSSGQPRIALGGGGNLNLYYTNGSIKVGIWHHMVVVIEPTGTDVTQNHVRFYLDGVLQTTSNTGSSGTIDLGDGAPPRMHWFWQEASDVYYNGSASNLKIHECALTAKEVKTLYDMGRNGKIIPKTLQIDTPVQINAPLYAPKNVINITQSFYDGGFATTATTLTDVYTTEWIQMRKNSEVEVDLSVLYRNDGTAWGGMYLITYFMVDVPVGSVAADTWVAYATPGYYMGYYAEIYEYNNTSYLPFKIPTDYKIRFKFQVRVYNGTSVLYVNRAHHLHFENSQFANLSQFIPMSTKRYEQGSSGNDTTYFNGHTGGTKYIIKEIAG